MAAIDNGLAFPHKHPDNWRAYPYHWAWLPFVRPRAVHHCITRGRPSSRSAMRQSTGCCRCWRTTCSSKSSVRMWRCKACVMCAVDQLHALFSQDKGFSNKLFEGQMSVLRGQVRPPASSS